MQANTYQRKLDVKSTGSTSFSKAHLSLFQGKLVLTFIRSKIPEKKLAWPIYGNVCSTYKYLKW